MRIGIDARPLSWSGAGGIPRVCRNLISALEDIADGDEILVFTCDPISPEVRDNVSVIPLGGSYLRYIVSLRSAVKRNKCDVLLSLSTEPYCTTVPTVCLLYDVYPLQYLSWLPKNVMFTRHYWKHVVQTRLRLALISRTRGVASVSKCTQADLLRYVPTYAGLTRVTYPGVSLESTDIEVSVRDARTVAQALSVSCPFFLYLGAINGNKNVSVLIRAFHSVCAGWGRSDLKLILIGAPSWPVVNASEYDDEDIIHINWAPDELVATLMSRAVAFILLSNYEGFGLPALEAMALGAPVIVSDGGSLPEVVGNAALIVDPHREVTVVNAMRAVLLDETLRKRLIVLGKYRATQFSWPSMAVAVYGMLVEINCDGTRLKSAAK